MPINQIRSEVRPFMTEDFSYRFQKFHPNISQNDIEQKYDSTPIYEAPYNDIKQDSYMFRIPYGKTAFYTPKVSTEFKKQFNNRKPLYSKDYFNFVKNVLNTKQGTITLDNSQPYQNDLPDTVSHEIRHMYDHELEGITEDEQNILRKAYPNLNLQEGDDWQKEAISTNTELRNHISRANNGVIKEDLDKVIDNTSDQDLYNMYLSQNGYTGDNNYYKKNKYQEFLDYWKTPKYKSEYLPYVKYIQEEDNLKRDLRAYDDAKRMGYGYYALKEAKWKTKNAKKLLKQRSKSGNTFNASKQVIDMYNKYGKFPSDTNFNIKELDPEK